MARVGFLYVSHAGGLAQRGIENSLRDLGYIAGKNILYESRYANWQSERLPELTDELLRQKVDVIVAISNISAFPAKKTTETVPIVVWGIHGAVATGLVRSLARPGGNVTGVESMAPELDAKRLHLIKEIVPKLTRLGVVYNPEDQGAPVHFESTREAARILGVRIVPLPVKRLDEFDRVLSDTAAGSIDALLTFSDPLTGWNWRKIAEFASKHGLPTVCEFRDLVEDGCLVSYGPSYDEFHGIVARQVDKILKGATPGDLPVEQVNRFEMLVNTKAAKALGITIPPSVLMKANEVVE
jgi:putative ABC transport system substrate-binding protein